MKKLSAGSFTLTAIMFVVSIMLTYGVSNADTSSSVFHALDRMAIEEHGSLIPMTDDQLASIEGGRRWERGGPNVNVAAVVVVSNNICVLCNNVNQTINTNINVVQLNVSLSRRR